MKSRRGVGAFHVEVIVQNEEYEAEGFLVDLYPPRSLGDRIRVLSLFAGCNSSFPAQIILLHLNLFFSGSRGLSRRQ